MQVIKMWIHSHGHNTATGHWQVLLQFLLCVMDLWLCTGTCFMHETNACEYNTGIWNEWLCLANGTFRIYKGQLLALTRWCWKWYARSGRYCHSSILDIISLFCHLIATLWPIWFVVFKMKIVETGHLTLTIYM